MRPIDAYALMKYCLNQKTKTVDCNDIARFPTIEPERKKGKWNVYYHGDTDFSYSCNMCGYSAPYDMKGGKIFQKEWTFCANCGADMRGEPDA